MVCVLRHAAGPAEGLLTFGALSLQGRPLCCVKACFPASSLSSSSRCACRRQARAACVRHKRAEVWRVKVLPMRPGKAQARRCKVKPPRRAHPAGNTAAAFLAPPNPARKLHRPAGQSPLPHNSDARDRKPPVAGLKATGAGRMMCRTPQGKPFACLRGPGMQMCTLCLR